MTVLGWLDWLRGFRDHIRELRLSAALREAESAEAEYEEALYRMNKAELRLMAASRRCALLGDGDGGFTHQRKIRGCE